MNKILIVDDEVNIGILLSKFLTRNGYEVTTSTSGETALEYMTKENYNLVLCDFRRKTRMAGKCCEKLKQLIRIRV
jgi:two-component system response regulator HydG